jgi:UDP-N-acetylmuramate--alanine ligase
MEGLKKSFLQFAYQTKGLVIGCADDILVEDILSQVKGLSYGFSEKNKITAKNILFEKEASSSESSPYAGFTSFDFFIGGEFINRVKIPLFGRHNVLNTLSVLGLLDYLGEDLDKAIGLLRYFKGTKRRFQVKKQVAGITFIDDYAHHPTEIKAVLEAARYLKPKRIFVVFQPHRFSRVKSLYQEFSHCFSSVDKLIVTDIYSAQEIEIDGISGLFLTEEINKNFASQALYIPKERLISEVPLLLEQGDMVLGLGAGDINIIMDGIIYEFQNNRIKA